MPLFDFKCPECGTVREVLMNANSPALVICNHDTVHFAMTRQPCAPNFKVKGFNAATGYAGERTIRQNHGNGIRSEVKGNFEGFQDIV